MVVWIKGRYKLLRSQSPFSSGQGAAVRLPTKLVFGNLALNGRKTSRLTADWRCVRLRLSGLR
jgi:hypothetical protein